MIRSQSQEENQVDFEYQWLTKFGRTSARKNLDSLKEKVNNIIKVAPLIASFYQSFNSLNV